ncbi:MAG: hypothetical protein ACRC80_22145 [Waterburya sp.]
MSLFPIGVPSGLARGSFLMIYFSMLELRQLFPGLAGNPVTNKLRLFLQQKDLNVSNQQFLLQNSYLHRLVKECELFVPEIVYNNWFRFWEYQASYQFEAGWVESIFDWGIDQDNSEIRIFDWLGQENSSLAIAQAYLLHQKPELKPYNISIVTLTNNPLTCDYVSRVRRINLNRYQVLDNDLVIVEQEINKRLNLLKDGQDLVQVLSPKPEPEIKNPIELIADIPEVVID